MRNLLLALCLMIGTNTVFAAKTPMPPFLEKAFKELNSKKVANAHVHFGTTVAGNTSIPLGVFIPTGAVITNAFAYIGTGIVSGTSGTQNTLAFGCEATNDLLAAMNVDPLATNSMIQAVPTNATSSMIYVDSSCEVKAFVGPGSNGISEGDVNMYIEFLPNE